MRKARRILLLEIIIVLLILLILFVVIANLNSHNEYKVTFITNTNTNIDSIYVKEGDLELEPDVILTKDGYTFTGWYLNSKKYDFKEPIRKDITLEAHWELIVDEN